MLLGQFYCASHGASGTKRQHSHSSAAIQAISSTAPSVWYTVYGLWGFMPWFRAWLHGIYKANVGAVTDNVYEKGTDYDVGVEGLGNQTTTVLGDIVAALAMGRGR